MAAIILSLGLDWHFLSQAALRASSEFTIYDILNTTTVCGPRSKCEDTVYLAK